MKKWARIPESVTSSYSTIGIRPVLANLGFLLQISGVFTLPSIAYALFLNEFSATISLFITASVFFVIGFILNAMCERRNLNLRQSCALMFLFYVIVTAINCIPYIYLQVFQGNIFEQFSNSWFETISASTTTGLTLMSGITVPRSLILARGFNEWVGGIGIVFILLSSFYPTERLDEYSKALGFEKFVRTYRGTFFITLIIYSTYTLFFTALLLVTGLGALEAFHTVLTVFSTTGLTMVSASSMPISSRIVITLMMLASALSFVLHYRFLLFIQRLEWPSLIRGNRSIFFRSVKKTKWRQLFSFELKCYLVLLGFLTLALCIVSRINPFQSFYHIVDFSSSCGLGVVNFQEIGEPGKLVLVAAMFIGPMSFSIGGGIRVLRAFLFGKLLVNLPKTFLTEKIPRIRYDGDEVNLQELTMNMLIIALFALLAFTSAWVLTNYGYSFCDALVESVSAITTTGDSPIELTSNYPIIPKVLLSLTMLLGRIEIIPPFVALTRVEVSKEENYTIL